MLTPLRLSLFVSFLLCALTFLTARDFGIMSLWSVIVVWGSVFALSVVPIFMVLFEGYNNKRKKRNTKLDAK